jgi:hypothetical protein
VIYPPCGNKWLIPFGPPEKLSELGIYPLTSVHGRI